MLFYTNFLPMLSTQYMHWFRNALIALGALPLALLAPDAARALSSGDINLEMATEDLLIVDSK